MTAAKATKISHSFRRRPFCFCQASIPYQIKADVFASSHLQVPTFIKLLGLLHSNHVTHLCLQHIFPPTSPVTHPSTRACFCSCLRHIATTHPPTHPCPPLPPGHHHHVLLYTSPPPSITSMHLSPHPPTHSLPLPPTASRSHVCCSHPPTHCFTPSH